MRSRKVRNGVLVGLLSLSLPAVGLVSAASAATPKASDVQAAQAKLDQYLNVPKFTPPNAPFSVKSLKGKTLALVAVDQTTPALEYAIQGAQQAASVAGLRTTVFDAKDDPSLMIEGVEQAIAHKSAAIALVGIPVGLITKQLSEAAKAGIPVVNVENNQPSTSGPGQGAGPGVYATASENMALEATLAADGAIVQTKGKARAIIMYTPGITPAPPLLAAYTKVLKSCSGCTILTTTSTQLADWSTGVGPQTTSALDAYPTANVVLPIFSTMALFAVPAIQQSGKGGQVTLNTTSANEPSARLMESDSDVFTGASGHSDYWCGWLTVDQAIRGMLKLKPGNPAVPTRWLTPATVKGHGTTEQSLFGTAYVAGFEKLWGLRG